jgi:hypothetical protein
MTMPRTTNNYDTGYVVLRHFGAQIASFDDEASTYTSGTSSNLTGV